VIGLFTYRDMQKIGAGTLAAPAPTATVGPSVPIEAFNKAMDTNLQFGEYIVLAGASANAAWAGAEISKNCAWGLGMLAAIIVGTRLLGRANKG
jgi:hypothetical protein